MIGNSGYAVLLMGGDAFYVWSSVAAAVALMVVELAGLAARGRDLAARSQPQ